MVIRFNNLIFLEYLNYFDSHGLVCKNEYKTTVKIRKVCHSKFNFQGKEIKKRLKMFKTLFVVAAIFGFASCAPATGTEVISPFESGFDIFSRLCVTMLPEHGDSTRQPEPFPVTIVTTPSIYLTTFSCFLELSLIG